jgi:hypothetical protein
MTERQMDRRQILEKLARKEISQEEAEQALSEGAVPFGGAPAEHAQAAPDVLHGKRLWSAVASVLLHAVLLAGIAGVCVVVVPPFLRMFAELRTNLPVPTRLLLALSLIVMKFGYLIVPVGVVLIVADAVVCLVLASRPSGRALGFYSTVVSVGMLLFVGLMAAALLLALRGLI